MTHPVARRLPAEQRRRSILVAALTILSHRGYAGMTTARIACRVGVAEPILYRHFSSKRAILRALLRYVVPIAIAAAALSPLHFGAGGG